jgi:sporulation protein YlmC with PRC-barrel domain
MEALNISVFRLSSVIGKNVYTTRGRYVGRVTDVSADIDGKSVSAIEMRITGKTAGSGTEVVLVPYELIVAIDDIVLLGSKR